LGALLLALSGLAAALEDEASGQPHFCGNPEKHQVIDSRRRPEPGIIPKGKARIYMYWRGARWRWLGVQCKVALHGSWVAVLSPNTFSMIDVEPGNLKFCGASNRMAPTWRSLLFLHATAGETYHVNCSPGGDQLGVSEPTLSEPEQAEGRKAVSGSRLVTFRLTQGR
jgi:hypothetical protein